MITNGQIHDILCKAGVPPNVVRFKDVNYDCPGIGWLQDTFLDALEDFRKKHGISKYVPEGNDCDDFALDTLWFAKKTYRHSKPTSQATFPVGNFGYRQDNGNLHEINTFIVDGERLVFHEPQADRLVQLSKSEINSCIDSTM